jgi:hypothetical protein
MQPDDLGECILLSDAEGWNQTADDWKRFADGPQNRCIVAESEGKVVGTAAAIVYAGQVAWIAMVLVNMTYRGRGISKLMLSGLLNRIRSCATVKLDATPAGFSVYEKFGFKAEYDIFRMTAASIAGLKKNKTAAVPEPVRPEDIPGIISLDRIVFGADRSYLINSLLRDNPGHAWCLRRNDRITSFALSRQGRKYFQVGPVTASRLNEAKILIAASLQGKTSQPVVVDVRDCHEKMIAG